MTHRKRAKGTLRRTERLRAARRALVSSYPPGSRTNAAIRALLPHNRNGEVAAYLHRKLSSPHWKVRASATAALEVFATRASLPTLTRAARDSNDCVRSLAFSTLCVLAMSEPSITKKVVAACRIATKDRSSGVRRAAYSCLSHLPDPTAYALLKDSAKDHDSEIRSETKWWLAEHRRNRKRAP